MQPTGTVWTTLVEDHPGIISVKFGKNPMSGFRGEVDWMKKFTHARTHARRTKAGHNSLLWALCALVSKKVLASKLLSALCLLLKHPPIDLYFVILYCIIYYIFTYIRQVFTVRHKYTSSHAIMVAIGIQKQYEWWEIFNFILKLL